MTAVTRTPIWCDAGGCCEAIGQDANDHADVRVEGSLNGWTHTLPDTDYCPKHSQPPAVDSQTVDARSVRVGDVVWIGGNWCRVVDVAESMDGGVHGMVKLDFADGGRTRVPSARWLRIQVLS